MSNDDNSVPALELIDVAVAYDAAPVVQHANLAIDDGEIVAIVGASGSGKSTLLRAIAGLEPLHAGRILMHGRDMTRVPTHRRNCGMVFQDGQLFAHRSVARNIAYGLEVQRLAREERAARVAELLQLVGLEGYGERSVTQLSGGQAQRVALARSLAPNPQVMLLDEPFSALDRDLRERLAVEVREILRANKTAALHVTHDLTEAATIADRIVEVHSGGLREKTA